MMSYFKKLTALTIFTTIIYCNLAVILNYLPSRPQFLANIPIPRLLADNFIIFGIFGYYVNYNSEMVVMGKEKVSGTWEDLSIPRYLPEHIGRLNSFLSAYKHSYTFGTEAQKLALNHLSILIKKKYNEEHPDSPITQVAIKQLSWPQSRFGFRARQTQELTQISTAYIEPEEQS